MRTRATKLVENPDAPDRHNYDDNNYELYIDLRDYLAHPGNTVILDTGNDRKTTTISQNGDIEIN